MSHTPGFEPCNTPTNIQKLSVSKSIEMKTGSGGMVLASEEVKIPLGYVGILAVRRSFGPNKLSITSQFLEGGFQGYPELHLLNGGNELVLIKGQVVVNLIIVKGING